MDIGVRGSTVFDGVEIAQAAQVTGEAVGQITALQGSATITRTDGTKVQAADGVPIFQGDVVETTADGAVGITFADQSTFSLADSGSMTIDEMVYDPSTQSGKSVLNVAEGVFTFVSGQIAKTDVEAMTISTPVAVIGIRGTSGGGKAGAEGTPNTFSMFQDAGGGTGEMTITTQGGAQTLSSPNQTTQISSAYVPPTRPVILPPAAVARFYAKASAVAPVPVITQPTDSGPTGTGPTDSAGTTGPTDAEPAGDAPADAAAGGDAGQAAEQAFEQVLAEGGSLEDAMAAAVDGASEAEFNAVLADNPDHFGTTAHDIMDRIVDNVLLGVTGNIDPMGAGTGSGTGQGKFSDAMFKSGLDHFVDDGLGDLVGGFFDDFIGHDDKGGLDVTELGFQDPFDIFNKEAFEEAFNFEFEEFLFDIFVPVEFDEGVLGFNENPFFFDDEGEAFQTTGAFDDFVDDFTTSGEARSGGTGNTRFTMVQGSTLGGADTVFGGGGTDELAFENLSGMAFIFDAAGNGGQGFVTYSNAAGSVTGSVTMDSIEQIYVDDGAEARVRFPIELAHGTGFGYIIVGTSGADTGSTLSVADGLNLDTTYTALNSYSYTGGGTNGYTVKVDSTGDPFDAPERIFGSVIFANAGDDTIVGAAASDIIYGGSGNDTITAGGSGEDGDIMIGGDGNDIFIFNVAETASGSIKGGTPAGVDTGTDTVRITTTGTVNLTEFIIQGVEALDFTVAGTTLKAVNTFFQGLTGGISSSGGTTTLLGQGDLKLSGITGDSGITTLGLDTSISTSGAIIDFTDTGASAGRTINGTTGQNTIVGYGGGDSIDLGADAVSDSVYYRHSTDTAATAGSASDYDIITNFDSGDGDNIFFAQDGTLASSFLDATNTFSTVATNGANLASSGYSVVFISNTVTSGDLTTAGFANVLTAIGTVTAGTATASDAENDAIFILGDGSSKAGIYLYTNQDGAGAGNTTVEADELTLLATVDESIVSGDINLTATTPT